MSPAKKATTKAKAKPAVKKPKAKKKQQKKTMADEVAEFWANPHSHALNKLSGL